LQFMLLVPTWVQNIVTFVGLTFFLQQYQWFMEVSKANHVKEHIIELDIGTFLVLNHMSNILLYKIHDIILYLILGHFKCRNLNTTYKHLAKARQSSICFSTEAFAVPPMELLRSTLAS
jgi:hypothetical protein